MRGYVIKWCSRDGVWKYHRSANHGSREYTIIIIRSAYGDVAQLARAYGSYP